MTVQTERLLVVAATPPMGKPTLGGNHRYLASLLRVAGSLGLELHVISDEHPAYAQFLDGLSADGVRRHAAPFCSDPDQAAAALDAVVAELRPLLVHVNGHQGWLAPAILRSREFPRARRRLFTMHLPVQSVNILETGSLKRFIPGTWSAKTLKADAAFLSLFDRVLSVSERFGKTLVRGRMLDAERLVWIPNAVDVDRFQPHKRQEDGKCIVGGAGNLTEQKRFDLLIEAFAAVKRALPAASLRIAGEGEDRQSLEALARRLHIEQDVRFVGFQPDMAAFYNDLDIFVLSSGFEAAPYVALEAAACGKPSVLTDVGDIGIVFRDGVEAWITPPNDVGALADRILALARDPEMRSSFSRAARELIVRNYSQPIWSQRIADFFAGEAAQARQR